MRCVNLVSLSPLFQGLHVPRRLLYPIEALSGKFSSPLVGLMLMIVGTPQGTFVCDSASFELLSIIIGPRVCSVRAFDKFNFTCLLMGPWTDFF